MSTPNIKRHFLGESYLSKSITLSEKAHKTFDALTQKECLGREWTGWWHYPRENGAQTLQSVLDYKSSLDIEYDCIIVIGIGGSYLGTRAVDAALGHPFGTAKDLKPIYYFGHHLSEKNFNDTLNHLSGKKPIVCMISKSGTTTEPGICFRIVRQWLQNHHEGDHQKRIVAITDPEKGALRRLAQENHWISFSIPQDVGGRFSVLTPVGIVPLALAGFDVKELMAGADQFFSDLATDEGKQTIMDYATSRLALHEAGKKIEILSITDPNLFYLAEWWKQLFGESEGKNHKGLYPSSMLFTTDLHSLGQYAQDGQRTAVETFLTFGHDHSGHVPVPEDEQNLDGLNYLVGKTMHDVNEAARLGTLVAHYDGGMPCMEIQFGALSERTLGQAFAFFQSACALSALLLDVNPFNQPGVEDYKKNLFAIMGKPGFENQKDAILNRLKEP